MPHLRRARFTIRFALAGTSLLALSLPAFAQDATQPTTGADGATELETLTVTGGSGGVITADGYVGTSSATGAKVDTPFLQTPQSISSDDRTAAEGPQPADPARYAWPTRRVRASAHTASIHASIQFHGARLRRHL
jgi:outer membrane receptor protein involved in Fe transport